MLAAEGKKVRASAAVGVAMGVGRGVDAAVLAGVSSVLGVVERNAIDRGADDTTCWSACGSNSPGAVWPSEGAACAFAGVVSASDFHFLVADAGGAKPGGKAGPDWP